MGAEQKLSADVFTGIHGQNLSLWNDKSFFDWAASKGLDRKKVEDIFGSFAIDGKYVTSSDRVGTHAALPPVIDALIAKARAEHGKV